LKGIAKRRNSGPEYLDGMFQNSGPEFRLLVMPNLNLKKKFEQIRRRFFYRFYLYYL
jgi:hypothetical protein